MYDNVIVALKTLEYQLLPPLVELINSVHKRFVKDEVLQIKDKR